MSSEITFRAQLSVDRRPRQFCLDLSVVPDDAGIAFVVHLDPDDPEQGPEAVNRAITALVRELQDPSGAVRFVDVTLRPADA